MKGSRSAVVAVEGKVVNGKGLRNKRSKKSPKAVAARLARQQRLAGSKRHGYDDRSRGDAGRDDTW